MPNVANERIINKNPDTTLDHTISSTVYIPPRPLGSLAIGCVCFSGENFRRVICLTTAHFRAIEAQGLEVLCIDSKKKKN